MSSTATALKVDSIPSTRVTPTSVEVGNSIIQQGAFTYQNDTGKVSFVVDSNEKKGTIPALNAAFESGFAQAHIPNLNKDLKLVNTITADLVQEASKAVTANISTTAQAAPTTYVTHSTEKAQQNVADKAEAVKS